MQKKQSILLVLLLVLSLTVMSQFYGGGLSSSLNMPHTEYRIDSTGRLLFKPGDIGVSMQVGTSFAGNFNGNSSFGTYVSPALAYNVSSKFRIKAGVSVFTNFGDPYYTGYYDNIGYPVLNSGTTTSLFVQGDYLLSNKLMLSGTFYKDFNSFNADAIDPRVKSPESQGVILSLNYRPSNTFEFNASFEYGSGNRSMLNTPFYHNGMFPGNSPW